VEIMGVTAPRLRLVQVFAAAAALAAPVVALAGLELLRGRGIRIAIGATARVDLHRRARAGPGVEVDLITVAGRVEPGARGQARHPVATATDPGSAIRGSPQTH
jgi:hypothetical protein